MVNNFKNRKERGVDYNITQIFCSWLWFAGIFFILNISTYSPALPMIIAFIFTLVTNVYFKYHITSIIGILFIEGMFLLLTLQKNKMIKRSITDINDLIVTTVLFILYLTYLHKINKSFYKIYFKTLPSEYTGVSVYNYYIKPFL